MRKAGRRHQKPTLMWIPEAHRPVRRSRLPRKAIWLSLCAVATSISAFVLWQYQLRDSLERTILSLSGQIVQRELAYDEMERHKDHTIHKLQDQLFQLSEQADQLELQMRQIRELEQQLQSLAESPEFAYDALKSPPLQVLSASGAVGGEAKSAEDERFDRFVDDTFKQFEAADEQARKLIDQLEQTKAALEAKAEDLRTTPSIYPSRSRSVTSGYGYRRDPFTGRVAFHSGIDFDGDTGDAVYATADGEVTETGFDSEKGRYIVIRHQTSLKTVYMHLSRIRVNVGDFVEKGDRIGDVGNTGRSTGSHLHYEVHENGSEVNPNEYLP